MVAARGLGGRWDAVCAACWRGEAGGMSGGLGWWDGYMVEYDAGCWFGGGVGEEGEWWRGGGDISNW